MTSTILKRYLRRASRQVETTLSLARAALLVLAIARLAVMRWEEIGAGHIKYVLSFGFMGLGLVLTGLILRQIGRVANPDRWMVGSVLLDLTLAFLVVAPSVIWPHSDHLGVLRVPDFALWPMIVVAAGMRLSPRTAWTGFVGGLVAVIGLLALDTWRGGEQAQNSVGQVLMALSLVVVAGLMAVRLSTWVRSLVFAAGDQATRAAEARQVLGAYVSEEVVAMLDEAPLGLGGEARDVVVLFSDLRGFTSYSATIEPDALLRELNEYFETMVAVIRAHGGVVDKYIGDAIMVVFGIPQHAGDEVERALRTALGMREALGRLNLTRESRGLPPLRQGIGIHCGPAVAGNIGTLERRQFTVIGDTVNFASRLEAATKEVGVDVLVSEAAADRLAGSGTSLQRLAEIAVRGKQGRHAVYGAS